MSQQSVKELKPFISVIIIMSTLFLIVFVKMELRRVGYVLWKQSRVEKKLRDKYYQNSVLLAEKTGPDRLNRIAHADLDLQAAHAGQIVQMTNSSYAMNK